jgi:hypothetical protein
MPKAESSGAYLDRVMALASSQARLIKANRAAAANPAGANTANDARLGTANNKTLAKTNQAAAANHADVVNAATTNHAGVGIESHIQPTPEASRQIDQFAPLPLMVRVPVSSKRKIKRDRGASSNGGSRGIILRWLPGVLLAAGLAWALTNAPAQPQPAKPKPAAAAPAKNAPAEAAKQQQQSTLPVSTEQALYLIRSTLLTLNDANRSGNYTVLRDLAAPDFQGRNTAADLSQIFSDLRQRNFDLYGAALLAPQLTAVPALDQRGYLHLTGFFPTRPQQIDFDLLFQNVANQWRLFGIAINTPQAPTAARQCPIRQPEAAANGFGPRWPARWQAPQPSKDARPRHVERHPSRLSPIKSEVAP